ncbi:cation diffusion facilitator family transporter [Elioraea sp.]|uniref:cation diffusion facilitator family transporter n=1 Tax=Elioraea sp. TaxID=2185103 RepID=UPI0021DBB1D4|nr:cation diffusion facilitator family transporter [Elioraea sp.]GIX10141.1 MAG: cobalt transporter [Elioraea sp.]
MSHDHAHDHAPDPPARDGITTTSAVSLGTAFRWGVALNLGYTALEAGAGVWLGSLALLADAAHNLTDVAGLVVAWAAAAAARRAPTPRYSYGLGRGTILAALANAIAILIGVGAVAWEAVGRLAAPPPVPGLAVLLVACVGVAVNLGTARLFHGHHAHDLNAKGAYLHMLADAAVSLGVVAAAAVMLATGWWRADPLAALAVSAVIAWSAFGLLRESLHLALDGVPAAVDREAVAAWLAAREGVAEVHDLHVWALSTRRIALTAHLVMPGGHPGDAFLARTAAGLAREFGIDHASIQIELGDGPACPLAPAAVV